MADDLQVSCDFPHFAPSVETVNFVYVVPDGKKIKELTLKIQDRHGSDVFHSVWNEDSPPPATCKLSWGGLNNQAEAVVDSDGEEIEQFVNPLGSPYTARLEAVLVSAAPPLQPPVDLTERSEVLPCKKAKAKEVPAEEAETQGEGSAEIKVLYRAIELKRLEWEDLYLAATKQDTLNYPEAGDSAVKLAWVQYRLNELGYLAGPLHSGAKARERTRRALRRYSYGVTTLDSCWFRWQPDVDEHYGEPETLDATPKGNELLDCLKAGTGKRNLVEEPDALQYRLDSSRVIIDSDNFYEEKEFASPDKHVDYDREKLDTFCWPLQVEALLLSKNDPDGTGGGKPAPRAIGPIECEWVVWDPPEDTTVVPPPTEADVKLKSRARAFLHETHQKLANNPGNSFDPGDNAPEALGGRRPKDGINVRPYFFTKGLNPVFADNPRGQDYYSVFQADPTANDAVLGTTAALFQGSYIAGDNYIIEARLSFDNVPDGGALKADHLALSGLEYSFGFSETPFDPKVDVTVARTGRLTIWRRHHVLDVVDWCWESRRFEPVDWFPIVDTFRAAHTILVPPQRGPVRVADFVDQAADRQALVAALLDAESAPDTFQRRRAHAMFHPDGLYPLSFQSLDEFEAELRTKGENVAGSRKERYLAYEKYIKDCALGWPNYATLVDVCRVLRRVADDQDSGPGAIVVRADYLPYPDFEALLPRDVLRANTKRIDNFSYYRGVSTGMDWGVIILETGQYKLYADRFFFSHELSHTLFGSHAFELPSRDDHDARDKNCIMYYNTNNEGWTEGWGVRSVPDEFTVSIRVSSDGSWRNTERYARVSGSSVKKLNERDYEITGNLAKVQSALHSLKIKPAVRLTSGEAPPAGAQLEIKASPKAAGRGESTTGFRTDPDLSNPVMIPVDGGTERPFRGIQLTAIDLKDTDPRFCGKCLLKLRGWKVRDQGGAPEDSCPKESPEAVPVHPRMEFAGFSIVNGHYLAVGGTNLVELTPDATDPADANIPLGPYSFLHKHKLSWQSSGGNLSGLKGIKTREQVKFRSPTQGPPFNDAADPDQDFTQEGDDADSGTAFDDHSVRLPALFCANPRVAGTLIGEQWYQYQLPGGEWTNIPGAAFLLEKSVYHDGEDWILKFKKSNWSIHNSTAYSFEVDYVIGPAPVTAVHIVNTAYKASTANPHRTGGSVIYAAGAREGTFAKGKEVQASLAHWAKRAVLNGYNLL